jgi:DNA-binding response OmpR family regulator
MGSKQNFRAIIAETEAIEGAYLRLLLEKNGWKADVVQNGGDLLKKLEDNTLDYSLVLMHRDFCQSNGFSALRRIKDFEKKMNRSITIVGVTSYSLTEERKNLLAAGVDYCLTKPVYNDIMVSMLENIINRSMTSSVA